MIADTAAPVTDDTLKEMKNSLPTLKSIHPNTGYAAIEAPAGASTMSLS